MYVIVETWTTAKGYSLQDGFGMLLLILGTVVFVVTLIIIIIPFTILGILFLTPFILLLVMVLFIFWRISRNAPREKDWEYKDFPTFIELRKEIEKDGLIKDIRKCFRDKGYKLTEVPYNPRFPLQVLKQIKIDNRIQLDICSRGISENPWKKPVSEYKYLIVIFIGPISKENKDMVKNIQTELDALLTP